MTGEEAVIALKVGIEALFIEARMAVEHERSAHVTLDGTPYTYVAFLNGHKKPEDMSFPFPDDIGQIVTTTIESVMKEWPDHAAQKMIWRVEPEYEWRDSVDLGGEAGKTDARHSLYCRLVAVPA